MESALGIIGLAVACIAMILYAARGPRDRASQTQSRSTTPQPSQFEDDDDDDDDDESERIQKYENFAGAAKRDHRVSRIRYRNSQGDTSKRDIFVYEIDEPLIHVWDRSVNEPRTFRLDRIIDYQLLAEVFEYDPKLAEWWEKEGQKESRQRIPWERWKLQR